MSFFIACHNYNLQVILSSACDIKPNVTFWVSLTSLPYKGKLIVIRIAILFSFFLHTASLLNEML